MAVNVGSVEVLLTLRDALTAALAKPQANLVKLSAEVRKVEGELLRHAKAADAAEHSHKRSGNAIEKFGQQIRTTLVHVAAAAVAYRAFGAAIESVSDAVELTRTFEKIKNLTGVTRDEVDQLKNSINQLSTATGRGPQELAEGFYFVASAGLKGAAAVEVLTAAANASALGMGETKDIARSLTAALNAYGVENLSAATAVNQLFIGIQEGSAEANEVAGVFGRVVAIANEMKVSFAEVAASVATFTRVGVGADEAVTALRGTLATLLKPDDQTHKAISGLAEAFGRTTMSAADLRKEISERGLADVLIQLVKATEGNVEAFGDLFPNIRAMAGILANAGSQAEEYTRIVRRMSTDTNAFGEAVAENRKSASFQWDLLKAQLEQLALTFGEKVLPAVVELGEAMSSLDSAPIVLVAEAISTIADVLADVLGAWNELPEPLRDFLTGKVALGQLQAFNQQRQRPDRGQRVTNFFSSLLDDDVYGSTERLNQNAFEEANRHQRETLNLLKQEDAFRAHAREMIEKYNKKLEEQAGAQRQLTDEQKKEAEQRAKAAAALEQRGGEILNNLRNQAAVAAEQLALAKARAAGDKEAVAAIEEQLTNREIQLEVERTIAGLDNDKARASQELRREIEAQVAARVRDEKAAKGAEEALRRQTVEVRNQETIQDQLARIVIQRREGEQAIKRALEDQAAALQQQLVDAHEQVVNSREYLAALVSGGREAARVVELQQQYLKEYGSANTEMARAIAAAETEQEKLNYLISKVGEISKPAWQTYLDAAFDAINAIGDALADVLYQAAMEGKVNWESVWESLKSSLLKIFIDMLADMLKRWIATQLAMRAASESINAGGGANATGGGGGLTGSLTNMGLTASASGGTSGASAGGVNWGAVAGYAVIAWGLYVIYKGFIEDHKRKFASVTLGDTGNIISQAQHGTKYMAGVISAVESLRKSLTQWLDDLNIEMTKFANITIISQAGKWIVSTTQGGIGGIYKTAEEAIEAAMALMVRFGEFAESVPKLVQDAVRGTKDISIESLTSNIAFARELLTQNMTDVQLAMHSAIELFSDQMRRASELFGIGTSSFAEAALSITTRLVTSLRQQYNQLAGIKENPVEERRRREEAYNTELKLAKAQILMWLAEIQARRASFEAGRAYLAGLNVVAQGTLEFAGALMKGGGMLIQAADAVTQAYALAEQALNEALAALPPTLGQAPTESGARVGQIRREGGHKWRWDGTKWVDLGPIGIGGGGGGGAVDGVRSFIEDQRFQLAQAGRSPIQQEIENIRRSFKEQLDAAGKNVKLRQELLALEQQAIEAARKRFQEDVENRFKDLTGQTNAFTELRKRFGDMRRDINDAGFAAERMGEMMRELARAEADALRELSQQVATDLLGGLAQYIQDEKTRNEFTKQAAIIKFNLDMANYKAQFAILKAQGLLSDKTLKTIQDAIDYIERNPPDFSGGGGDEDTPPPFSGHIVGERTVWNGWIWTWNGSNWLKGNQYVPPSQGGAGGANASDNPMQRALELLRRYQEEGLSKWQRALLELNRDFTTIRNALGDTPEVMQAYADALARLRNEFLEGLREFYDALKGGEFGGTTIAQQFQSAGARYQQLLGSVRGGDLSQADALRTAAQQFIELASQMFGTSTGGFLSIREQILRDLETIFGITNVGGGALNNVIGGPEWFNAASNTMLAEMAENTSLQVDATNNVASVVSIQTAQLSAELRAVVTKLDEVVVRLDSLDDETTAVALGYGT